MSLILRHEPQAIGITVEYAGGWASVDALLAGMSKKGHTLSVKQLENIVNNDNKQRYNFNADKSKIRANQGHSIDVDLQLATRQPPDWLYHGTASRFMDSIQQQGLQKRQRHHVHLSKDKETAHHVGSRHGKSVILTIAAGKMYRDGYAFYCSDNGVWLVESVPPKYFA